jgi:hypothetical protein
MDTLFAIPDYEGLYSITRDGRVWSHRQGKWRKFNPGDGRYNGVILTKHGKQYHTCIHRLLATIFIPNPENKPCINHINANKSDNRLENLEWVTSQENNDHAQASGLFPDRKRSAAKQSKYKNVSWYQKDCKWVVRKRYHKGDYYLGSFDDEDEAYSVLQTFLKTLQA